MARALGRIRRTALLTVVLGLPLVFLWDVANAAYDVPKTALLVVCVAVAAAARAGEALLGRSLRSLRAAAAPAAFVAVPAALAWLASDYRSWALMGSYGRFGGVVPIVLVAAAGVLLAEAFGRDLRRPAWALAAAAGGVSLYAVVQAAGADPFGVPVAEYVPSTVGHSNYLGAFLAIALPLCLGLWTSSRGAARYAAMGLSIATGLGIVLSFSQGGWLAAAAGVAVFAGATLARRRRLLHAAGWVAAAGLAAVAVGIVLLSFVDPFHPAVPDTVRARGLWWRAAISMGAESPVWGRGPEVFAIEGAHHRNAADALAHDRLYADQPHSVPLAHFANHGVVGVAGFVLLAWWTVRRAWRAFGTALGSAFGAGAVAYFTQALVSIDATVVTLPFWVCVAGLAASSRDDAEDERAARSPARAAAAIVLVTAAAAGSLWWAGRFVAADVTTLTALETFGRGRTAQALDEFEDVLDSRDNEGYRHLYGSVLGAAAVRERDDGGDEVERMREVFSFLRRFPDVSMMTSYGDSLHQWAVYDPALEEEAREQLADALALDQFSPTLRVLVAEAQLRLGRPDEAIATVEALLPALEENPEYTGHQAQVWGVLAIAHFYDGSPEDAGDALARATTLPGGPDECRALVAHELLRTEGEPATRAEYRDSSPGLLLCKPATLALLPGWEPQRD